MTIGKPLAPAQFERARVHSRRHSLAFTVKAGDLTLPFNREIEIAENIGLKQSVPLLSPAEYVVDKPQEVAAPSPNRPGLFLPVCEG